MVQDGEKANDGDKDGDKARDGDKDGDKAKDGDQANGDEAMDGDKAKDKDGIPSPMCSMPYMVGHDMAHPSDSDWSSNTPAPAPP